MCLSYGISGGSQRWIKICQISIFQNFTKYRLDKSLHISYLGMPSNRGSIDSAERDKSIGAKINAFRITVELLRGNKPLKMHDVPSKQTLVLSTYTVGSKALFLAPIDLSRSEESIEPLFDDIPRYFENWTTSRVSMVPAKHDNRS